MTRKSYAFVAGVSVLALSAMPAWAQDMAEQGNDAPAPSATAAPASQQSTRQSSVAGSDIIVTARRRAEVAQDVPLSIIAFDQNTLKEAAISSADELGRVAPGLLAVPSSGNPSVTDYSIRGRGLNFGAAAGSVETYFAEVPLSPPFQMPQLPPQFFDIASVQVLKGPQGTLFGRSTTGGAVLIQPQTPTDYFEGYGRVQTGNYNNLQLEGAINIPVIADTLAIRLAGFHWKRNGYMRTSQTNPDGSIIIDRGTGLPVDSIDYNNKDVTELRGSVRLTPTDGFENVTIVTYHRDHNLGGTSGSYRVIRDPGTGVPVGTANAPGVGEYTGYLSATPARGPNRAYAIINTTSLDVGENLTLRNIFGYKRAKGYVLDGYDPDGTSAAIIDTYVGRRRKLDEQFTNELQLQGLAFDDRLEFTIGGLADLIREPKDPDKLNTASVSSTTAARLVAEGLPSVDPDRPNASAQFNRYLSTDIDSYALFAAGSFDVTDSITLSGGYRHTWDEVSAVQASTLAASGFVPENFLDADPDQPGFQKTRNLNAKFQSDVYNATLQYEFTDDVQVYAGYRHGFKRGGFNSSAFGNFPSSFGPEEIDSYSLGLKSRFYLADTAITFNLEGFYDDYQGYQASYLLFAAGNLLTLTTNIPKATYTGFDAELGASISDAIDINLNYAFVDPEIKDFPDTTLPGDNPGLENNELTFVSRHQLQASMRFHGETDWGEWVLRPAVSYRSKFYTTLFNRSLPASQAVVFGQFDNLSIGGATVPGVTLVDMRFELNDIGGSTVSAALGATNLLDEYHMIGNSGTLSFGVQGNSYGPPRMLYGEVSMRF